MNASLSAIVTALSERIAVEPDREKRAKLQDARELVRDCLWDTEVAMQYGDSRKIIDAQNLALRHLAGALRCALGPPGASVDAAVGHGHVNRAIVEIERAEALVKHTDDPFDPEAEVVAEVIRLNTKAS